MPFKYLKDTLQTNFANGKLKRHFANIW